MPTKLNHKSDEQVTLHNDEKPPGKPPIGFKYMLHHTCHRPGCEGTAGMEVTLDTANHEWFQKHVIPGNGATLLGCVYAKSAKAEKATDDPADSGEVENRKVSK